MRSRSKSLHSRGGGADTTRRRDGAGGGAANSSRRRFLGGLGTSRPSTTGFVSHPSIVNSKKAASDSQS